MESALVQLLWLRVRGGVRSRLVELATVRGIIFLAVTIGIIGWLLVVSALKIDQLPAVMQLIRSPADASSNIDRFMPAALLAMALFSVFTSSGPALYFSAAEINLLFTAPISRRGLLLYKFTMYAAGALMSAGLMALIVSADSRLAIFVAVFMTLIFKQLFAISVGMGIEVSRRYLDSQWHRYISGGLAIALISALIWHVWFTDLDAVHGWDNFRQGLGVQILLAPFVPFARLFVVDSSADAYLLWTFVALAINVLLVWVVIRLDAATSERSLVADEQRIQRWTKIKDSGRLQTDNAQTAASRRPLRFLGGTGAIAWRQWVIASRDSARTVGVYITVMIAAGLLMTGWPTVIGITGIVATVILVSVFFLPRSMVFDFRSDIKCIERFKALPMAPWRICLGQLAVPVLLTSLLELVLILCAQVFAPVERRWVGNSLIPFLVPFNLVLYSVENLLFLLMPTALMPVGRMDFEFIGRTLVDLSIKAAVLMLACVNAVAVGAWAHRTISGSFLTFGIAAWVTLMATGLLFLPLLAMSLRRFDVSLRGAE